MLILTIGDDIGRLRKNLSGLDFDPLGTLVASVYRNNVCLISDIDTNNASYQTNLDESSDGNFFLYSKKIENALVCV